MTPMITAMIDVDPQKTSDTKEMTSAAIAHPLVPSGLPWRYGSYGLAAYMGYGAGYAGGRSGG